MNRSPSTDFAELVQKCRRVLLTTHVRPDGDALGSVAALALALRSAGKSADILLLSKLPTKYRFVLEEPGLSHLDLSAGATPDYSAYDTIIVADTGTFSQLPGLEQVLPQFEARPGNTVAVIDHHKTQEPWGHYRIVDTAAASATELIAALLKKGTFYFSRGIAEAIYVGLVSDTGWFAFSNTTPTTLRLAADLMEAGVDPDRMYQRLFQSEREPRLRLQTRAQESMQLLCDGRLAVLTLTAADFAETRAGVPDTENVINFPLQLASVQMSLLITESPPPDDKTIKVSCRSKGAVDVAKFAEQFGGGGHSRASGLKLPAPLARASDTVIAAAVKALS